MGAARGEVGSGIWMERGRCGDGVVVAIYCILLRSFVVIPVSLRNPFRTFFCAKAANFLSPSLGWFAGERGDLGDLGDCIIDQF